MIREPVVNGIFYPDNKEDLRKVISNSFLASNGVGEIPILKEENIKANYPFNIFVPHAGYDYSALAASFSYSKIVEEGFPETFIIISPNHTGLGTEISIFNEGIWKTPLGDVSIDVDFANSIIENSTVALKDFSAHLREHSIEVQLPFLQFFSNNFKIVPITMGNQTMDNAIDLANSIYKSSYNLDKSYCVIASTDLSHFNNQKLANKLDSIVLNDIAQMNSEMLFEDIDSLNITMCGYGPVVTAILISKLTQKTNCDILTYYTSGDITDDFSKVVGYASGVFK